MCTVYTSSNIRFEALPLAMINVVWGRHVSSTCPDVRCWATPSVPHVDSVHLCLLCSSLPRLVGIFIKIHFNFIIIVIVLFIPPSVSPQDTWSLNWFCGSALPVRLGSLRLCLCLCLGSQRVAWWSGGEWGRERKRERQRAALAKLKPKRSDKRSFGLGSWRGLPAAFWRFRCGRCCQLCCCCCCYCYCQLLLLLLGLLLCALSTLYWLLFWMNLLVS